MAGALLEAEWVAVLKQVGLERVRVADVRWDSFRGAPRESADAIELGAECIAFSASKPQRSRPRHVKADRQAQAAFQEET